MIEIGRGGGLVLKIASFGSEKRSGGCFELERKKGSHFLVRSLYRSFTEAYSDPFPWGLIWRSWTPMRGSVLEQNFNHRPTQKEGMEYAE